MCEGSVVRSAGALNILYSKSILGLWVQLACRRGVPEKEHSGKLAYLCATYRLPCYALKKRAHFVRHICIPMQKILFFTV